MSGKLICTKYENEFEKFYQNSTLCCAACASLSWRQAIKCENVNKAIPLLNTASNFFILLQVFWGSACGFAFVSSDRQFLGICENNKN